MSRLNPITLTKVSRKAGINRACIGWIDLSDGASLSERVHGVDAWAESTEGEGVNLAAIG